MAIFPLEMGPRSVCFPLAGACFAAVLVVNWSNKHAQVLADLVGLFNETTIQISAQHFGLPLPLLLLSLPLFYLSQQFLWYKTEGKQRSVKKVDSEREESLGQSLVRHLRSIRSHTISFNPNEVDGQGRSQSSKPGLLKRLAGRLRFGLRDSSFSSKDAPPFRRGDLTRSNSRRFGEMGPASSRSSASGSVFTHYGSALSPHKGVLDALLVNLRRPQQQRGRKQQRPGGMARIASGTSLNVADGGAASSVSEVTGGGNLRLPRGSSIAYNGHLAADCLGHDMSDPHIQEQVSQFVSEDHLLQLGALMGESSSQLALSLRARPGPGPAPGPISADPDSLFGSFDAKAQSQLQQLHHQGSTGWEQIVEEHKPSVHYWGWRHPLRRGLYIYRSRTVYECCTTEQMLAFHFQSFDLRKRWDESLSDMRAIPPANDVDMAADELECKSYARSGFVYARTKFPPPMAQREYIYARRVWRKPDDGGCYIVTRACPHPAPPPSGCRSLMVTDISSGTVIRAVPGIYSSESAVEVVTNYFEDSRVSSGIINMGVRKAMWPMVQKSEGGLRTFISHHFNAEKHKALVAQPTSVCCTKPPTPPLLLSSPSASPPLPSLSSMAPYSLYQSHSLTSIRTRAPILSPAPLSRSRALHSSMLDLRQPTCPLPSSSDPLTATATTTPSMPPSSTATPTRSRHSLPDMFASQSTAATDDSNTQMSPIRSTFHRSVSLDASMLNDNIGSPHSGRVSGNGGMSSPSGRPSGNDGMSSPTRNSSVGPPESGDMGLGLALQQDSLPIIPASWGDYHPALTRRFHFTPLLYKGYLAAWSNTAAAARMAAALGRTTLTSLWHAHVLAWTAFQRSLTAIAKSGVVVVVAMQASIAQCGGSQGRGKGLSSHPIKDKVHFHESTRSSDDGDFADSSAPFRRSPAPRKAHWSKRLFVRVTSLAVKAVGVPLAHRVLSGKVPPPPPTPVHSRSSPVTGASHHRAGIIPASTTSQPGLEWQRRQASHGVPGRVSSFSVPLSREGSSVRPPRAESSGGSSSSSAGGSGGAPLGPHRGLHQKPARAMQHASSKHKLSRWSMLVAENSEERLSGMPTPLPRSAPSSHSAGARTTDDSSAASGRPRPKRYLI